MGFLTGKTAIITGAGRAVLSDGRCGSIGYGIATAYAKEGANLVITGRNVKKLEDEVQFMIKDTGSGISKKILDHIFEEFVTNTNVSNDSQKGIGLGLAICKAIIQAHGGIIWAKNEKDGACFIFTIPSDKELNV